jgi:hypothetical protein
LVSCRSSEEAEREKAGSRTSAEKLRKRRPEQPWEQIDTTKYKFVRKVNYDAKFATFHWPKRISSLLYIFEKLVPEEFIQSILSSYDTDSEKWLVRDGKRLYKARVDIQKVYQTLAVQIFLIGQQSGDIDNATRPLRASIFSAKSHLENESKKLGSSVQKYELITSRFHIASDDYDLLSRQFQKAVVQLGEILVCDEKLYFFSGESKHICLVITKPDRVGLWMYEACVKTEWDNLSFLVDICMKEGKSFEEDSTAINTIVTRWENILKNYPPQIPAPKLVFDSYYFDNTTRLNLNERNVAYEASAKPDRLKQLDIHFDGINKPGDVMMKSYSYSKFFNYYSSGDWATIWCEGTGELVSRKYEKKKGLGIKTVVTNAFKKVPIGRGDTLAKHTIPAYDQYEAEFGVCDRFNSQLGDAKWPFRRGGRNVSGESGTQHSFAIATILINTFNAHRSIHRTDKSAYQFSRYCKELSLALFEKYAY